MCIYKIFLANLVTYNPINGIITIGYFIETLGNVIKMLKNISHNYSQHLLLYKLGEQSPSGLGRFLECRKCNILVITQALVLCLIYTHFPSGAACPWASCTYIRQSTLTYVVTYTYIYMYMYIYLYIYIYIYV